MSYHCTKCSLIFKSKVFLFEHLNKVHLLDVDDALRGAGLKYAESNKTNTENSNNRSSGKLFKCQLCDFTTSHQDVLTQHEKLCHKTDNPNLSGTVTISEISNIEIIEVSTNPCNEGEEGAEDPSFQSLVSTSKGKCTPSTSKDIKTYKRPQQTITKYFAALSESNENPCSKVADDTDETPISHETPSSSNPSWSSAHKVSAKYLIDISNSATDCFLQNDHLLITDHIAPKSKEQEGVQKNVGRRTTNESLEGPPAKRSKTGKEKTVLPESEDTSKPSGSSEFSFEVSDDETEKKVILVDEAPPNPKVYFCKQCDYTDKSFKRIIAHYNNDHPYVRCNALYIQNPNDQSATFRCLECPVEFLSPVDLKWHYVEKHPEAPDVFKIKLNDLSLIFKCFSCPFTTSMLKDLREHYKEQHPAFQVDNSLVFCQYSVGKRQEELPQPKRCKNTPSPEKFRVPSPERGDTCCKEAGAEVHVHYKKEHSDVSLTSKSPGQNESKMYSCGACGFQTSSQSGLANHYNECCPVSAKDNSMDPLSINRASAKGAETTLYKCIKCQFRHKSAVVMHVHYKKTHPDKAITIDKIKRMACNTSHETSQMVPEKESSLNVQNNCEVFTSSLPEHRSEASKNLSKVPTDKCVKSVQDETTATKMSSKSNRTVTAGLDNQSSSSHVEMFYCQMCSYTSPSVRGVLGHHNAKHSMHSTVTQQDIIDHSDDIRTKKLPSETPSKARKQVKLSSRTQDQFEEMKECDAYAQAENLFYCQKCNFGNPSLQGVLNHQGRVHQLMKPAMSSVLEHTASIQAEIIKSRSLGKGSSSSTYLPLPIINKEDEDKFFCSLCNYRQTNITLVLQHYSKKHHSCVDKSAKIYQYTSMVLNQWKSPKKQEQQEKTEKKQRKANKIAKATSSSSAPTTKDLETTRKLRCYVCTYSTPIVFLLRMHMRKAHRSNRMITDILRVCFRQGTLEAGFHCEWCVFSHTSAAVVHRHYQEHHPDSSATLEYVRNRLYVGPFQLPSRKKKRKRKPARHGDGTNGSLTSKGSGQNESKTYPCTICSFISRSQSGLSDHWNEFHPTLAQDHSLDRPSDNRASAKSQFEDLNEMPGLFESFQVPLDADEATASSSVFKCTACPASFNTQRGLNVHCGIKHLDHVNVEEQALQTGTNKMRVHLFKCPYCTYVNTTYQGILTHCQMRHPAFTAQASSLHVDTAHLYNRDECIRKHESGEILKFSGYMCKSCSQVCVSLDKLNRHCEQEHKGMVPDTLKPATKPSSVSKTELTESHSTQKSVSKASFHTEHRHSKIRCQHCSYVCTTKIALSQHIQTEHQKTFSKYRVHKCMVCPHVNYGKKKLRKHYLKKHGKTAYLKYYVPLYRQVPKQAVPTSQDHPVTEQQQNKSSQDKRFIFKCPKCVYVHSGIHGILTHCQMKHPTFVARGNHLETDEILVSNIVGCSYGKGSHERGYLCEKCPLIYPSLSKLKFHSLKKHGMTTAPEVSSETEDNPQSSVSEAEPLKDQTPQPDITESIPTPCSPTTSNSESPQNSDVFYKCQICRYTTCYRKSLHGHYKHTHKLNAVRTYRMLEKYNKRKRNYLLDYAEYKRSLKCKMCPDSMFKSPQSLIEHYSAFHRLGHKSDFTVLSLGLKHRSTGLYKCAHCMTQLNGTKKLSYHLEQHRNKMKLKAMDKQKKASPVSMSSDAKPTELCREDEVPTSAEELLKSNGASAEAVILPPRAQSSPSKVTKDQPEEGVKEDRHPCKLCHRSFSSQRGLRSHASSHSALEAIRKKDQSQLNHNIKSYIVYKTGNLKPFLCGCCSYRTNLMGLLRSHILKNHQDIIQNKEVETKLQEQEIFQTPDKEPSESSEKTSNLLEFDEETEDSEESTFLEPANVQRQLNHYSRMAQNIDKTNANVLESTLPENSLLHCEICNFNTERLSNIRRHYMNRHGKKMLRCKNCEFVTGLQKILDMHMQIGHSTFQPQPTHEKDLRCPFCLYQTKNKNSMIDHIILHREERVVPIEVRRPKLSRYLQGIVFRCHKCTFSSGSAENLRLHIMRHDEVRPYQCRLCYFYCTRQTELEAHLSDKHQVLRNHELVGQVSLKPLETSISETLGKDDKYTNIEEVETEELDADFEEVPQTISIIKYDDEERMLPAEEVDGKQELDENEESPSKSSLSDTQYEDAQPNSTVQKRLEQDPQSQEVNVALNHTAERQSDAEQDSKECNIVLPKDCSNPEKKEQENSEQTRPTDEQKEKAAEGSSSGLKATDSSLTDELHQRSPSTAAKVEDEMVHHNLQEDEDGSKGKSQMGADQKLTIKKEQDIEGNDLSDNPFLHKENSTTSVQDPETQVNTCSLSAKMSNGHESNTGAQGGFRFQKRLLTLSPSYTQLKLNFKSSSSVLPTTCKHEQNPSPKPSKDASQPCGEIPVLENECHKLLPRQCKEEEETDDLEQKQVKEAEMITEDETQDMEQDTPKIYDEEFPNTDEAAEVLFDDKLFTCQLCGRNLRNLSDLSRHIMRHGL